MKPHANAVVAFQPQRRDVIPVRADVRGACEILGLDPLTIANEGKLIAVVAPEQADGALAAMRAHPSRSPSRRSQHYRGAQTVDEVIEKNVAAIAELEREAKSSGGWSAALAGRIAAACGSMGFVVLHVLLFAVWIFVNTWRGLPHLDPFPYTFLTLMVSLEAIFLSAFILIAQNEETRLAERRNALDLQINLLAEQENTKVLRILQCIAQQVGAQLDDDPAVAALEQATRPDKLAAQIDRVTGGR